MTVINPTVTTVNTTGQADIVVWSNMASGDVGFPVGLSGSADRSVQVEGLFGVSPGLSIEGTNDDVNWRLLKDHLGNNLNFTAAGIQSIDQIVKSIRPNANGGDGTTNLTVTMLLRRLQA